MNPEPVEMTSRALSFWHDCFEEKFTKDQISEIFEKAIDYFEKQKEEKCTTYQT